MAGSTRRVPGWPRDMLPESVRWVFSSARNRPFGSVSAPGLPDRVPVPCVLVRGTCLLRRCDLAAPFSLGRGRSRHRSGKHRLGCASGLPARECRSDSDHAGHLDTPNHRGIRFSSGKCMGTRQHMGPDHVRRPGGWATNGVLCRPTRSKVGQQFGRLAFIRCYRATNSALVRTRKLVG